MSRAIQYNPAGEGFVELGDTDTLQVGETSTSIGTVSTNSAGLLAGTTVLDTFADTDGDAAIWHYVVKNGGNRRAGTITAVWDPALNVASINETSTGDLGSTVGVTFAVAIVIGTNMVELRITTPGLGWTAVIERTRLYQV